MVRVPADRGGHGIRASVLVAEVTRAGATEFRVMALLLSLTNRVVPGVAVGPERNMRPDLLGVFGKRLEFSGFSIGTVVVRFGEFTLDTDTQQLLGADGEGPPVGRCRAGVSDQSVKAAVQLRTIVISDEGGCRPGMLMRKRPSGDTS